MKTVNTREGVRILAVAGIMALSGIIATNLYSQYSIIADLRKELKNVLPVNIKDIIITPTNIAALEKKYGILVVGGNKNSNNLEIYRLSKFDLNYANFVGNASLLANGCILTATHVLPMQNTEGDISIGECGNFTDLTIFPVDERLSQDGINFEAEFDNQEFTIIGFSLSDDGRPVVRIIEGIAKYVKTKLIGKSSWIRGERDMMVFNLTGMNSKKIKGLSGSKMIINGKIVGVVHGGTGSNVIVQMLTGKQ